MKSETIIQGIINYLGVIPDSPENEANLICILDILNIVFEKSEDFKLINEFL